MSGPQGYRRYLAAGTCPELKAISRGRDVSGVKDNMFHAEWDVSEVTNMGGMFHAKWDVSSMFHAKWDVSEITNMGGMFHAKWDVSEVTNMSGMFMQSGTCPR